MGKSDGYVKLMCIECGTDVCYIDFDDTVPSILCNKCYTEVQLQDDMKDGQ